jgi:hypothetical protein
MDHAIAKTEVQFRDVLSALVAIDLGMIVANGIAFVLHRKQAIAEIPHWMDVAADWSLPEMFNYFKWLMIVVALLAIASRERAWSAVVWAAVFLMIFLDDAFQLHESLGTGLAASADFRNMAYFRGQDFGEIAIFGLMGLVVALLLIKHSPRKGTLSYVLAKRYLTIVGGLVVFGVLVDAAHIVIQMMTAGYRYGWPISYAIGLIEDGGEMVVASFAVAVTLVSVPGHDGADTQGSTLS